MTSEDRKALNEIMERARDEVRLCFQSREHPGAGAPVSWCHCSACELARKWWRGQFGWVSLAPDEPVRGAQHIEIAQALELDVKRQRARAEEAEAVLAAERENVLDARQVAEDLRDEVRAERAVREAAQRTLRETNETLRDLSAQAGRIYLADGSYRQETPEKVLTYRKEAAVRLQRMQEALNEISLKLSCAVDHTAQPEVRCPTCHQHKSGAYWCAGCVARRGLRPPEIEP